MKRRRFLTGAGTLGLAIPFLPSLVRAPAARAATVPRAGIKRVVFLVTGYGAVHYNWFPDDSRRTGRRITDRAVETDLSSFVGPVSPVFDEATWNSAASGGTLLDNLLMLDGIDGSYGTDHDRHYALNGHAADDELLAPSVDQLISGSPALYESDPLFRSMHAANGGRSGGLASVSTRLDPASGNLYAEPSLEEPRQVWAQAFEGLTSTGAGPSPEQLAQLHAEGRSVIDNVWENFDLVRNDPRLSRADQDRLAAYMEYVREFERGRSGAGTPSATCEAPLAPADEYDGGHAYNNSQRSYDHIANIVSAVRCGLSSVFTFDTMPGARAYRDLGSNHSNFHDTTHSRDGAEGSAVRTDSGHSSIAESLIVERHDIDLLARLMRGLDVVEDPTSGATFLDNTLIVMTSSMGTQVNHRGHRMPLMLAGARNAIRGGKLIDYRSDYTDTIAGRTNFRIGMHYNKFLVTIAQLMGLSPADYEYGQEGIGNYGLSRYQSRSFPGEEAEHAAFAIGDKNEPLLEALRPEAGGR